MNLVVGLVALGVVAFQWLAQEVTVKIWGPWKISFHRDEWPAFFWVVLALELGVGALFIYGFFA
jgi:hypothetical protein